MNIIIKQVACTDEGFLDYYQNEQNMKLHRGLVATDGFPFGFIAFNEDTNKIVGAAIIVNEDMHNQLPMYSQQHNDSNPWMIGLAVTEKYRHQGIAKNIVNAMLEYGQLFNHTQINLNTETATDFYKKNWIVDIVSSDIVNVDGKQLPSDTIRIDIKKNLKLENKKAKLKI